MEHQNYTSNAIVKLCAHQGCYKPSRTKNLCYTHYTRFRKHGSSSACREKNYLSQCVTCKITFNSIGKNQMYCSKLCLTRHHRGTTAKEIAEREERRKRNNAISLLIKNIKAIRDKKKKEEKEHKKTICYVKICSSCSVQFITNGQGNKMFCSIDCRKKAQRNSEWYRRSKRIEKAKRRAKIKANFIDRVDPFVVFERDEWTCQICRIETPKYLRGTNDDRSPQLDHIIPLAKGGMHSYANTQCLCRKCNIFKGDKM